MNNAESGSAAARALWVALFLVLFLVALWVPFYNRVNPTLFGAPFFYWFQFIWIIVGAVVTGFAYLCKT